MSNERHPRLRTVDFRWLESHIRDASTSILTRPLAERYAPEAEQ